MKRPILLVLLIIPLSISAQITTDGTLGQALNLQGPDYLIGPNLGQQRGGNLFHSFQDFNLQSFESATFSGPTDIQNVISRVTGGNSSNIDGLIRSTIPNADFYFLNPYGIFFGPNARLDVLGSFHASTADYLRFSDGGRFDARHPNESLLTVAPIEAFGFLDSPAPLSIDGSQLTVPFEKTLSIISGNLTINQAQLSAPFGRINLASVAQMGDVIPKYEDFVVPALRSNITAQNSQISTSGEGGGTIYIRGGQFELINSVLESNMLGDQKGGVINLQVDHLYAGGTEKVSKISAQTRGTAQGGTIEIKARQIELNNGATITGDTLGSGTGGEVSIKVADTLSISGQSSESGSPSNISANAVSSAKNAGNGGHINIEAGQIVLTGGGAIQNMTRGQGNGGNITISVTDTLTISGGFQIPQTKMFGEEIRNDLFKLLPSSIAVSSIGGSGKAGNIDLTARRIILKNGGQIIGNTWHQGEGGSIKIKASDTLIATGEYIGHVAFHSGIMSNSNSQQVDAGHAGSIVIEVGQLELHDGADINSDTYGPGNGGDIVIQVADTLSISGQASESGSPSSISVSAVSSAKNAGNGGHINIEAGQIVLTEGGAIQNMTRGQGNGGNITISVTDTLTISGGFKIPQTKMFGEMEITNDRLELLPSGIAASSIGGSGNAGNIDLTAHQVILKNGGQIIGNTWHQGEGGSIKIKASDTLMATGEYLGHIAFHSGIMSNSNAQQVDAGHAGSIEIEVGQLKLSDGADINSDTYGPGNGGDIVIQVADTLSISGQASESGSPSSISVSAVSSKENAGSGGHINIEARQIILTEGGAIQNMTRGQGNGGNITISVTDTLTISGGFKIPQTKMFGEMEITNDRLELLPSGIAASSIGGLGKAGTIDLTARQIRLQNGGEITSSTLEQGEGGSINVKATDSLIAKGIYIGNIMFYSGMRTNSISQQSDAGNAGHIEVQANTVNLTNQGRISTSAANAGGGNIIITSPSILYLQEGQITTSVSGGKGGGGNITINNPVFIALNKGQIIAQADEGHGGNIQLISDQLMSSQESLIDASSRKGIDGVVFVSAPETDMSGQLLVLSTDMINAADQMQEPCGSRIAENLSHFVVVPREGVATPHDDLLPSGPHLSQLKSELAKNKTPSTNSKTTTVTHQPQWLLVMGCQPTLATNHSSTKREKSVMSEQLF